MLTFDPQTHEYKHCGRLLPSVTQIIGHYLNPYAGVSSDVLRQAAAFGTAVHSMCAMYLQSTLDVDALDPQLDPYLTGFIKFVRDFDLHEDALIIEQPMFNNRMKFAGTPDIVIQDGAIFDIKTRAYSKKTDPLQLAAYDKLCGGNGNSRPHVVVEIMPDDYKATKCNDRQAWPTFSKMLKHWHDSQKLETIIHGWEKR
jgi:hypothetical protein